MSDDFDMAGALSDIESGLGFEPSDEPSALDNAVDEAATEVATEEPVSELPAEEGESASVEDQPEEPTEIKEEGPVGSPKTWRKEALAEWEKLPPVVQAEILKREDDMYRGMEQYKGEATVGRNVAGIIQPYLPELQRRGIDPGENLRTLYEFQNTLQTGTHEQKVELVRTLLRDFQIDLDGLGVPYEDPATSHLQQRLERIESLQKQEQQSRAEAERTRLAKDIDAFATDPKNIYYNEPGVVDKMAGLLRAGLATTLADAYDQACKLVPTVRAKEEARSRQEAEKLRKEQAEKARQATQANVKRAPKSVKPATSPGSIEDTLNQTYAEIMKRV